MKWHKEIPPIICDWCGSEKYYHFRSTHLDVMSRPTKNKFCSGTCSTKHRNKKHGNPMENPETVKKSKRNNPPKFGSDNPNWKGGISHMNSHKYRKSFCELCGTTKKTPKRNFCVHHLDKNRKNNIEENLKTVCYSCHKKIHVKTNY